MQFDHVTYVRITKNCSPERVRQYLIDCGLEKDESVKEVKEVKKEVIVETIEPTLEQMKEILTSNDIKFSHLAGEKKLKELCIANNLM